MRRAAQYLFLACLCFGLSRITNAQTGYADIRTSPDSARITIDDVDHGFAPMIATLSEGLHRVVATTKEGDEQTVLIEVLDRKVTRCVVTIVPRHFWQGTRPSSWDGTTGSLTVLSEPPGAEIRIDGRPSGAVTPATIEDVPTGTRRVQAIRWLDRLQDRFAVTETVSVEPQRPAVVRIDFAGKTVEGPIQVKSNAASFKITLRHVASGKSYTLTQPGARTLVTGTYVVDSAYGSVQVPRGPIIVSVDSLTEVYFPVWAPRLPLMTLADHPSYESEELFLRRTYTPRPLSETRSDLLIESPYVWWVVGGTSLLLAGGVTQADADAGRASPSDLAGHLRRGGALALLAGLAFNVRVDTVHVDMSYNQSVNARTIEALRARYADLARTWQRVVDDRNRSIEAENARRGSENALLPPPGIRRLPLTL